MNGKVNLLNSMIRLMDDWEPVVLNCHCIQQDSSKWDSKYNICVRPYGGCTALMSSTLSRHSCYGQDNKETHLVSGLWFWQRQVSATEASYVSLLQQLKKLSSLHHCQQCQLSKTFWSPAEVIKRHTCCDLCISVPDKMSKLMIKSNCKDLLSYWMIYYKRIA